MDSPQPDGDEVMLLISPLLLVLFSSLLTLTVHPCLSIPLKHIHCTHTQTLVASLSLLQPEANISADR